MARPPLNIIEDEEEFLQDVAAFHMQRGTPFDRDGKVSGRPISLHRLYKMVLDRGGYDVLSSERMQWRTLVKEFGFGKTHEAVMTFQLKSVYYKNLGAYEITKYWGEVPPPREIFEDISAKGGNVRSRTLENFPIPGSHAPLLDGAAADRKDSAAAEEHKFSQKETVEIDDPGSAGRYSTRVLRQDPKRTQIFQPDTQPTRARTMRSADLPTVPPVPPPVYANGTSDPHNVAFDWYEGYEPRPSAALSLRPLNTPASDANFAARKAQAKLQAMPPGPPEPQQFLKQLPLSAMSGPNIYMRCVNGLRSGIPSEVDFALYHLVKVSHERGEKFKLEGFPLLAEALLEKAFEITELINGVKWDITYGEDSDHAQVCTVNATFGTANLLSRIAATTPETLSLGLETADFTHRLNKLNETMLIIRNMVVLDDNAIFMSKFCLMRDLLTIVLHLPAQARLTELKQSALDIADIVSRHWSLNPKDALYLTLLRYLDSDDRGHILAALRAINKIGLDTPDTHKLADVPTATVERLISFTLLDSDMELLEATLEFLYVYTATPENNTALLEAQFGLVKNMIPRLVHLLLYQGTVTEETIQMGRPPVVTPIPPAIPSIPSDLHAHLLTLVEPERSLRWIRCCFEESGPDDITQIAIWQAYQAKFGAHHPVSASEFIKSVTNTYALAQAQVINGPQPRFIIKGIKPRRILLDMYGRPLFKCLWRVEQAVAGPAGGVTQRHVCNSWHSNREKLFNHVLTDHLKLGRAASGSFIWPSGVWTCHWTHCGSQLAVSPDDTGHHVQLHMPKDGDEMARLIKQLDFDVQDKDRPQVKQTFVATAMDQSLHPCGVPFNSVMILRNLARFANKYGQRFARDGATLGEILFNNSRYALFSAMSVNRTLREYIVNLQALIEKGTGNAHGTQGVKRAHDGDDNDDDETGHSD